MRLVDRLSVRDTSTSPDWTPLRITAHVVEPIVMTHGSLLLDGPLAKGAFYEYVAEHGHHALPPISSEPADFDLPLATWARPMPKGANLHPSVLNGAGEVWGWCVSSAQADWVSQTKVEVRKRPPVAEMAQHTDAKNHNVAMGPMKAKDVAYPARVAWRIEWYALGDRDRVQSLLGRVPGLGKLVHHGVGAVDAWVVEEVGEEHRDSWMQRPLPADGGRVVSVRAPHHHRFRRVPCR